MSSGDLSNKNTSNTTEPTTTANYGGKKYNVHGKIVRGKQTGLLEISYYECDNIVCKKVEFMKRK